MFLVSGCVKHSVVVQVKSDGSGVVHIRHFEEETRFGKENEIKAPTRDELRKLASKMGDGVSLRSVEMKRDANGWHGFEILFDFKDVNKLILNEQGLASLLQVNRKGGEEKARESTTPKSGVDNGPFTGAALREIKLRHSDGVLTIEPNFSAPKSARTESETVDPFAGTAGAGSFPNKMALAMASPFIGAARFGFFVEVEPGIRQSNARFVRGKQIAIVNVNFGKLLSQKNGEQNLSLLDDLTAVSGQPEKAQKVCDQISGLEVDMTRKITVRTR